MNLDKRQTPRRERKEKNKAIRLAKAKRQPKIKAVSAKSNPKVYTAEEIAAFLAARPDLT
jgi:hypothetical protein